MKIEHEKIEALFDKAVKLHPEERSAFLAEACGADGQLRRKLEELLQAEAEAGAFLPDAPRAAATVLTVPVTEQPGDPIGRYKLLEKLGEGGFGVVYMAEQREPVKRRVALKIIKVGMDTREVVARFEAERQALALMDHPNIAKILDGGATETGRPYFVMELVRGIKLTEYCDERHVSTRERLELFMQVCQAVQHAHQKGIIHRDLKPSNILATVNDGQAVPKIIDFGIAKATQLDLTEKTVFTRFQQFIGTPAYMSPEQAEITSVDVDTRSDVYSLGVLLYELLTGKTPFDGRELLKAGLDEMRRTIKEQEPERPSTRVSTLRGEELTTTAKRRGLDAPKLFNVLRGDLDWIVMKCLEKDRARRYETANGLAADIQRHLSNEAVVARPPSTAYRIGKSFRRNRVLFAATASVVAALVIGFGISVWQSMEKAAALRRAQAAEQTQIKLRQQAEEESRRAAEEADIAQAVTDFLRNDVLRAAGNDYQRKSLGIAPNPHLTVVEALNRAAEGIGHSFLKKPLVEAGIRYSIGRTYEELGEDHAAVLHLARAVELYRQRPKPYDAKMDSALEHLATAYANAGQRADSIRALAERSALVRMHYDENSEDAQRILQSLGIAHAKVGQYREAIELLEKRLAWNKAHGRPEDRDVNTLTGLSSAYYDLGNAARAIELGERALRIAETTKGLDPSETLIPRNNLAVFYRSAGRRTEAIGLFEQNLRLQTAHLGSEHDRTLVTRSWLAQEYAKVGRRAEAERLFHESAEIVRKLPEQMSGKKFSSLRHLADFLVSNNQPVEAEAVYREAIQLARTRAAAADDVKGLESVLSDLADLIYRQGRHADAEPLYRELVERRKNRLPPTDENVVTPMASLGRLLADWAWSERDSRSEARSPESAAAQHAREAERLLRQCLAVRTARTNSSRALLGDTQSRLGAALVSVAVSEPTLAADERTALLTAAESFLLLGNDTLRESKSADARHRRDSLERLVRLYSATARTPQAAEWQQKLAAFDLAEAQKKSASAKESP